MTFLWHYKEHNFFSEGRATLSKADIYVKYHERARTRAKKKNIAIQKDQTSLNKISKNNELFVFTRDNNIA